MSPNGWRPYIKRLKTARVLFIVLPVSDIFISLIFALDKYKVECFFERKKINWTHVMLCQILIGPPIPNYHLEMLLFNLNVQCYPKMGKTICFKNVFEPVPGGMSALIFLNEEKLKKFTQILSLFKFILLILGTKQNV